MIDTIVSRQIGTGLFMSSHRVGIRARNNHAKEYETMLAAIVTIAQNSDSTTIATANRRQKATNGASAATIASGITPPTAPTLTIRPRTVPAMASQRTRNADRLPATLAAVYSAGEIGRLMTK